jgi:hypothetical protein
LTGWRDEHFPLAHAKSAATTASTPRGLPTLPGHGRIVRVAS